MFNNININFKNRSIEMTSCFAQKASIVGSEAYAQLISTRKEFPSFKIIIKKSPKRVPVCNRITYDIMEDYINRHENSDTLLAAFNKMRSEHVPFFEARNWFFEQYPNLKECKNALDWSLAA